MADGGTDVPTEKQANPVSDKESSSYFRKNTLDEMTVGRTEKPETPQGWHKPSRPSEERGAERSSEGPGRSPDTAASGMKAWSPPRLSYGEEMRENMEPRRGKIGTGSYEDPAEQRRQSGRGKKKTGRPGR